MAIMLSDVVGQDSKNDERHVIDLGLIEQIVRGASVALEGELIKDNNLYKLRTSFGENQIFNLRFFNNEPDNLHVGPCRIVGVVRFDDKLRAIKFIEVEKIFAIKVTEQKYIEGLMHQVRDLNEMAFAADGDQQLSKHIDHVKVLLMTQDSFFQRYFPTAFAEVKKTEKIDPAKDPFE